MILGYNKRESVAMAAILNKKNSPRWNFRGLFTRVFSGHPSNFPENFSFLHFSRLNPNAPGLKRLLSSKLLRLLICIPGDVSQKDRRDLAKSCGISRPHDDVIKWKHFARYWPLAWGIHRSQVNSPHRGQWRGACMFSLICTWINGWVNTREGGEYRCHHAHYDVTGMWNFMHGLVAVYMMEMFFMGYSWEIHSW